MQIGSSPIESGLENSMSETGLNPAGGGVKPVKKRNA
jgi:hypothetical protein